MDGRKIVVYVRAEDARLLQAQGKEPAEFVRGLVRRALDRMKETK